MNVTLLPGSLVPGDSKKTMLRICPECGGCGNKLDLDINKLDIHNKKVTCGRCWGRGYIELDPSVCFMCCGSGKSYEFNGDLVTCTNCGGIGKLEGPDYL